MDGDRLLRAGGLAAEEAELADDLGDVRRLDPAELGCAGVAQHGKIAIMVASSTTAEWVVEPPDVSHVVTEDDEPVDNFPSEKQQRLLVEPLYAGWEGPRLAESGELRSFIAAANVGIFATPRSEPLVPDVFISLDVTLHPDLWAKEHRTYFFWEMGKPPDVVIEIVSNKEGGEVDRKLRGYARMRVPYYVVYDPAHQLGPQTLRAWEMRGDLYIAIEPEFPSLALRLAEWNGSYEGMSQSWLRWVHEDGTFVPTGAERALAAEARTATAEARTVTAEARTMTAEARALAEKQRADRLTERLRSLGIDPDEV